tara:strand:+ start:607 stop:921 length:315 start_codon:yes stop_codon:yes gene_type:complete
MEAFRNSAVNHNYTSTFIIGSTFGIFLTFGNAWADFLKESVVAIIPENDNLVIQSFVYALSASFISLLLLCYINYMQKIILSKRLSVAIIDPKKNKRRKSLHKR